MNEEYILVAGVTAFALWRSIKTPQISLPQQILQFFWRNENNLKDRSEHLVGVSDWPTIPFCVEWELEITHTPAQTGTH